MQGRNSLAIHGPELEAPNYLNDEGYPLSASKMVMLYDYIDHFMEKGVRNGESDERLFKKFIELLRNDYGCYLAYCCVPELRQAWGEGEDQSSTLSDGPRHPNRLMTRLLDGARRRPSSHGPPKNPFTNAIWDDIKGLVIEQKWLQWLFWDHPDSAVVATQRSRPESCVQHQPTSPSASQTFFEARGRVGSRQFPQEEHDDRTRGLYSNDLLELGGIQPQVHKALSRRESLPFQETRVPVETDTGSTVTKHDSASMADLEEQLKIVQLMMAKKRVVPQQQDEVMVEDRNAGYITLRNGGRPQSQRHEEGGEGRPVRAIQHKPQPTLGGMAQHTGQFNMPWIPRADTGPAQGTAFTQGPRSTSIWGPEPAGTSRQDYGPLMSGCGSMTRRGSAFGQVPAPAQRTVSPQGWSTQSTRQPTRPLPPQDARHYETQIAPRGRTQGLGLNLGTHGGGIARGRSDAGANVGRQGSIFQPSETERGNVSAGQALGSMWGAPGSPAGQEEGHREEEQEDGHW
ncbi:hypothetical protein MMC11_003573 [Xylographa trunciseda]|nr:hypothetical protein [Xylographa trunciseda]